MLSLWKNPGFRVSKCLNHAGIFFFFLNHAGITRFIVAPFSFQGFAWKVPDHFDKAMHKSSFPVFPMLNLNFREMFWNLCDLSTTSGESSEIFGNLRKVFGNLRKIVKNVVISMFNVINIGTTYMVTCSRIWNFYSRAQLYMNWTLEEITPTLPHEFFCVCVHVRFVVLSSEATRWKSRRLCTG